jgi:PIN domain nuclease of toxin-antitoxin system
VKLLLDTHVLLWALLEPQKLSPELHNALENSDNTLVVSAASAWEIATKWRLGKLHHARSVVDNYAMALHRLAAVDQPISAAVNEPRLKPTRPPAIARLERKPAWPLAAASVA